MNVAVNTKAFVININPKRKSHLANAPGAIKY
jgi:hypothetical protein